LADNFIARQNFLYDADHLHVFETVKRRLLISRSASPESWPETCINKEVVLIDNFPATFYRRRKRTMSLLASLIQASTRFQQAMDHRQPAQATNAEPQQAKAADKAPEPAGSPGDDRFTPSGRDADSLANLKTRSLALGEYKQTVAQDLSFVRETLRHKLAEYNLHPATTVNVSKGENGKTQVDGSMPDNLKGKIAQDLNNNRGFQEAFGRLSTTEPTLDFMDNALKLNQAYGVSNSLLDSMVSENQQFNGLQDLVTRYDNLKRSASQQQLEAANQQRYAFTLNTRA